MAKKKASRPSAKGAKKKGAARSMKKGARPKKKKAVMRAAPAAHVTGLEKAGQVDFRPLKAQISAHIARLSSATVMTPAIENTLRSLRQVQTDLTGECSPTMIIPTP